ncbi:MAG: hypothetical protein LBU37_04365, partial [Tannerellaceae bacterium]|nr:hypothetical protein [Tannerellaceae bacterium]
EGKDKELAALKSAQEKEIAAVTGTTKQREEQITLINEIYRKKREEIKNKYTEAELQAQVDAWQLKLDIAEKGSKQEYTARINILEVQRKMEVEAATKTGADVNDINAYYDQQALAAFSDFVDAKITKAQEEADARTRMAGEAAAAEEAALLERWKNGEINEEQYNKAISDIRHKYSVQSIEDEINAFKQLLDNEKLTAEQRKEIEKKLYDAKKALSDEETSHEIENIKKVEEQRKKATQMAKDLAKQAFDMAMEFLTMQSEAKVAELDEELERIDELMNKELEALDNAVMSDETRAAEEKRIRAQAKADSDRVEEEKRKEQQKQAAYQKTSSIVQAIINTAQGITAALTIPVAGIALAAVVGALGAAQIAMIAAQPLPKYARGIYGDEEHPGGPAIVGDARKREYVLTPEGKLYETPAVPTLVDMEKGAQVFPDYRTMMQYFRPEIPKYTTSSTAPDLSRSIDRLEHAIKESKSVQHVSMNLDKNGIWLLSMNGKRNIRYINSRINQ